MIYRFLIYGYITDVLDRQILGLEDTVALTAVLAGYLLLAAIPSFMWSRKSLYHTVWRGIESCACYLLVALVLGAIFAAVDDGEWSFSSAIAAGGDAWAYMGSMVILLAAFVAASWLGGKSDAARRRRPRSREGRLSTKSDAGA